MLEWLARADPRALLIGLPALGALLAFLPLTASLERLSRLRIASGTFYLLLGVLLALLGVAAGLASASLQTFRPLTHEQVAANVSMRQLGEREFILTLAMPGAPPREFRVTGDEWQIDARFVRFHGPAPLTELDSLYRLERLSTYRLPAREPADVWLLLRRYRDQLPFMDVYAGGAHLPMADGARYTVSVSPSGMVLISPSGW